MRWKHVQTGSKRHQRQIAYKDQMPIDYLIEKSDLGAAKKSDSLEELLGAVTELQILVWIRER
jgi:hypothetical protein